MTYSNEYRLGRRVYRQHQEESLAFVSAVAVVLALAGGFYILANRFHIRPAQLVEFSLYALYSLIGGIAVTWYVVTLRKRREVNWPHPPLFVSQERDRKAVRDAQNQNSIVLGYNVHSEPWLWSDATCCSLERSLALQRQSARQLLQLLRMVRSDMSDDRTDGDVPTIDEILDDPAASFWLKAALRSALSRDPVDATNDADILARLLEQRFRRILKNAAAT